MEPAYHVDVDYNVKEHDRDWAVCRRCGAQWAIHQTNLGEDYEQVTEDDGYCEEQAS